MRMYYGEPFSESQRTFSEILDILGSKKPYDVQRVNKCPKPSFCLKKPFPFIARCSPKPTEQPMEIADRLIGQYQSDLTPRRIAAKAVTHEQ
jgi:hypothetical protein